jgi:hypothetical protein
MSAATSPNGHAAAPRSCRTRARRRCHHFLALKKANDCTRRVFSSRIMVRVISGSARLCLSYDYHNDFGSVRVSIEGRGSPPILASNPRNR